MESSVIEFLKNRGFVDAISSEEISEMSKKPIAVYAGFDPTADSLHLGNLVGIILLRWFQKFGHKVVVILGGATARIGDPSGRSIERPLLDSAQIEKNIQGISGIFKQILDFSNSSSSPLVLNNDQWYSGFALVDFLRDVGKHMRLGTMLAKDSVRTRLQSEEGISFTEFSYQMLQAYDFYFLNRNYRVVLQTGGSDQWGNITAGIDLTRKIGGESVYALTHPLLVRSDGKKFGKTADGAVWLNAEKFSPYRFYQYLYGMPDVDVPKMMRLLTFMDLQEIEQFENGLQEHTLEPNVAQQRLAEELTLIVHGKEGLDLAKRVTKALIPGGETPLDVDLLDQIFDEVPHHQLFHKDVLNQKVIDLLVSTALVASKGEGNRLIQNGGVSLNNQKIGDSAQLIKHDDLIDNRYLLFSIGKKKKFLVRAIV